MSDPNISQPHHFSLADIPMKIHAIWMGLIAIVWKGKSMGKMVVGVATTSKRLDDVENRLLKVEQTPQVTRNDIDVLRGELQGTLQANQSQTIREIQFLFTNQKKDNDDFKKELKEDIFKKYDGLDQIIQRLDKKVE